MDLLLDDLHFLYFWDVQGIPSFKTECYLLKIKGYLLGARMESFIALIGCFL